MTMRYQLAHAIALHELARLQSHCEQIAIAGSLRRGRPKIKDIEIVAQPRILPNLFGDPDTGENLLASALANAADWGWQCIKRGDRYHQYRLPEGINLDLFMVLPPAQWGVIVAIRTGPAAFSRRLVTLRKYGGLLPSHLRVRGGAIWHGADALSTPAERDVFDLLQIDYVEPRDRNQGEKKRNP